MVTFTVYGRIAGKGSRTNGVRKDGTRFTRPASKYEKPWVREVEKMALWRKTQGGLPDAPYRVELDFYFRRGNRPRWEWPSSLDVDKAVRATLDGLVDGGVLSDDRHVVELVARKHWLTAGDAECCRITVSEEVLPALRAA